MKKTPLEAMSEAEWFASSDSRELLTYVQGYTSDRKLLLFDVACIRQVSHLFTDDSRRQVVEVLERLECSPHRLLRGRSCRDEGRLCAGVGLYRALAASPIFAAREARLWAVNASDAGSGGNWHAKERQAGLIRDIFGNLFRPVTIDPAWLSPGVVSLARTIYDSRSFERMPELADALEEAGCQDTDLLGRCRQPGPHVRGCWVVDLLLGKS